MQTYCGSVNDNKGDFCKECRIKTEDIYEIKEELIRTQLKYEHLMVKYSKLSHEKEGRISQNKYEDCKATFSENQWTKALTLKEKHNNTEINNLRSKQKTQEEVIQKLTSQKERSRKKSQQIIEKQEKQLKVLRVSNKELQDKVNEKNKICKVMMAKIFSLETELNTLKQEIVSLKKTEEKRQQYGKQWKDEGIQVSFFDQGIILNSFIQDQLRDQLVYQFFEVFLKSFDLTRNQPSLEIFRLNLNLMDLTRLQPYCRCFNKFLELQSNDLPIDTEVTQKEKWILESFSCLKVQNDSQTDDDSKLVFLFRLSSLFYRIRNPMQGGEKMAGQKVLKKMKNELYNAFYNYLF